MKCLIILFAVIAVACALSADCPASSTVTTCTPKCKEDHECTATGGKCCPNLCNARSCYRPKANSKGTDKYSSSGGAGTYCGNVKCSSFEKCGLDSSKRQKCVRS
ncbi:unnamed protein product [Diamesa tonsa]